MKTDENNFFQKWVDFLTEASRPFTFGGQQEAALKPDADHIWEIAEDAHRTIMCHCKRLLDQNFDANDMPQLDIFMGFDLKLKDMADAYTDLIAAMNQLNVLNLEAATAPFLRTDLAEFSNEEFDRPLEARWQNAVDQSLIEMQRSQAYLTAKSHYVSCLTKFQKSYRSLVQSYQEYNHAPTLSEFEDLAKQVHEMRRELWALKKKLP